MAVSFPSEIRNRGIGSKDISSSIEVLITARSFVQLANAGKCMCLIYISTNKSTNSIRRLIGYELLG
jgi:hypothetical protein